MKKIFKKGHEKQPRTHMPQYGTTLKKAVSCPTLLSLSALSFSHSSNLPFLACSSSCFMRLVIFFCRALRFASLAGCLTIITLLCSDGCVASASASSTEIRSGRALVKPLFTGLGLKIWVIFCATPPELIGAHPQTEYGTPNRTFHARAVMS
ncbi:hypothetical protein BS47DRAFT_723047 [Hydnum rufescens UP504]|uniref:Uncharacterized protein n=1 Tax=Hydnum rufescens UP504 TaxID=1448309 RepID=A0A9P6B193_9AGAM|nr:hypothetical protein BS47DRAFT_723047 [Hydnum rufescens UP504]